jgi:SAM-dependent methyltransferase
MDTTEGTPEELNRAHWDALASAHGHDRYYDLDALVAGRDHLLQEETRAVGDVAGLDVLHVQCHIGYDSISLARRGARVTGVDFSPVSLEKAREAAAACRVDVDFVLADSRALPKTLYGRFDIAYATIGVLGWIDDVDAWMRSVSACLCEGGRLVLIDLHPLSNMVGSLEPLVLDFPYAFDGPHRFDEPGSYADPTADVSDTVTVQYAHSLGEIVTAAIKAKLRIDALHEHLDLPIDPRGFLTPDADGRYRLRIAGTPLPMLYTLLATRVLS